MAQAPAGTDEYRLGPGDKLRIEVYKLLDGAQYRRMMRYEARTLGRFDGVLAVSDADRDTFSRLYQRRQASGIPGPFAGRSLARNQMAAALMYHDVVAAGAENSSGFPGRDAALYKRHCARQAMIWNAKKMTKRFGGERYLQLRKMLLGHGNDVQWGDQR
jgi:hypothetical protein